MTNKTWLELNSKANEDDLTQPNPCELVLANPKSSHFLSMQN